MARLPLDQGIPRFKANEERIDIMTNGDENATWLTADGTEVPSVRKFYKGINTEGEGWLAQAAESAEQAALYDGPWVDDVAALLADTVLTYTPSTAASVSAGDYVRTRADGFSYRVMPQDSAIGPRGYHVSTAGGVLLQVVGPVYDVRAFGAISGATPQDGPIDMCLLVAAAFKAVVNFPAGRWVKSSPLELSLTGDGGLTIEGAGDGSTVLELNTGGNGLTINLPGNYWLWSAGGSTALLVRNIAFSTTNEGTGTGVSVVGASVQGRPGPSIRFENVMWRARSAFEQFWQYGLRVMDCQHVWLTKCRLLGGGPGNTAVEALFYVGGTSFANSPTAVFLDHCTLTYGKTGLEIGNYVEGVYLTQCEFIGQPRNVKWKPIQGESGLHVVGGHYSASLHSFDLDNVFDFEIIGALIYRNIPPSTPNARSILISRGGRFTISGNVFRGSALNDGETAIYIESSIDAEQWGGVISGNTFHRYYTRAVWLGANANYVTVGRNTYRDVAERVLNQGTTNTVEPLVFTGTQVVTLAGGSTNETFTVPLPLGRFRITPGCGMVQVNAGAALTVYANYDEASSSATSAVFRVRAVGGGNLPATVVRVFYVIAESVNSTSI